MKSLAKEMASDYKLYTTELLKKIYSFDAYYGNTFGRVVANSVDKNAQERFYLQLD